MTSVVVLSLGVAGALLFTISARGLISSDGSAAGKLLVLTLVLHSALSETYLGSNASIRAAVGIIAISLGVLGVAAARSSGPAKEAVLSVGWIFAALAFYVISVNVFQAQDASTVQVLGRILPGLVWLILLIAAWQRIVTTAVLSWAVLITFSVTAAGAMLSPNAWRSCSQFKCSEFGLLLGGVFDSENSFARMASLAVVAAMVIANRSILCVVVPMAVLVLVASESRTSQAALAGAIIGGYAMWKLVAQTRFGPGPLALLAVTFVLGVGTYIVYASDPADFSNRGGIWMRGRFAASEHMIFGSGIDNWTTDVLDRNYMHSQALLLLYSAGVIGLLLYALLCAVALRTTLSASTPAPSMFLLLIILTGVLEVSVNPAALDGTSIAVIALLVLGSSRRGSRGWAQDAGKPEDARAG